jgi:putative transposase
MREMDKIYLKRPFFGVLRMHAQLRKLGHTINVKRVARLFKVMGISAIYQKPNLSEANKAHEIYPYLLKSIAITHSNQVWSTDITYVPMEKGFLYKVAFIDWYSRYLLSYAISNTLDSGFVVVAFKQAVKTHGVPLIVNSDQGSQFTSKAFTDELKGNRILISMDGKGRALDNVMIERYWRSYKYECVYLNSITDGWHLKRLTEEYIHFYNAERLHQSLQYQTPLDQYHKGLILSSERA